MKGIFPILLSTQETENGLRTEQYSKGKLIVL